MADWLEPLPPGVTRVSGTMTINGHQLPWNGYGFASFTPTDAMREHAQELAGRHLRAVE